MDCANGVDAGAEGDRSKVTEFREQVLQLARLVCHEEEEKSRTDLLEELNKCNKRKLVELCTSFDICGSTANKKDELVAIVMRFLMEHCSNPDKKFKKRRRKREGSDLSGGKPSKKMKSDGTVLETHIEEEADANKGEEFDSKDDRNECVDNKKGQFPKEHANPEPSQRVNRSVSDNLGVVPLIRVPISTNEQTLATTPSTKQVGNVEGDNTDMKTPRKKYLSITKKKATPKSDRNGKSCGDQMTRGDTKPRKQVVKPSKDELRQAVFFILDTANFATMTFGDVVKEVDKYFGKDLFERKPLIRSLIEEELFRLGEEAEKKELEEEEAIEAKARAEQTSKERAKDGRFESHIDKVNQFQASEDGKSKYAEKNDKINSAKSGVFVKVTDNMIGAGAAKSSKDGKAEVDTKNENDGAKFSEDGKAEKVVQIANDDDGAENLRYGKAETAKQNDDGNRIGGSEDGRTEEVNDRENGDTGDGRTEKYRRENGGTNADDVNAPEAEEIDRNENIEHVKYADDGKAQESGSNEKDENILSHVAECGKAKEAMHNVNAEQSLGDADDDAKAEDSEHDGNAKVDVYSGNDGAAENRKSSNDAKISSDGCEA